MHLQYLSEYLYNHQLRFYCAKNSKESELLKFPRTLFQNISNVPICMGYNL